MIRNQLIAHRGWQKRFPENTLLAVKNAIDVGAKHIEVDIQLTADHIPVLFHDPSLHRMCNDSASISDLTLEQLSDFSAYEPGRFGDHFLGTPITPLSDCIELIANYDEVTLYVEVKQESLHRFGHDLMLATLLPMLKHIQPQCYVISFDFEILKLCKNLGWNKLAPVLNNWEEAFSDQMAKLQPPLLFCNANLFGDKTAVDLPYPCAIYEIDDYKTAEQLILEGAALIETFEVGELINLDLQAQK